MAIVVTRGVLAELIAAAKASAPLECCGLLLGPAGEASRIVEAHAAANVHPSPARHFEVDPAALIAALRAERHGGPAVVGWYHSHPNGAAAPSAQDRAQAAGDRRIWAIIAEGKVHFWRDLPQGFVAMDAAIV